MLFYHGIRSPYPWSLCWLDEFADPTTARKVYTAAFPLVDVTVVPDDEIVQHRRVALLELIQKHIRQRDLMELIDQLAVLLVTGCANDSQITALLNYILLTGDEARFHGIRSPYPWSLCWLDEFADPTTARKVYTAAFPLVDVTVVPDDEIVQHRRVALLELIQKHIRQRDLMELIDQLAVLLVTGCANDSQITALLNYILLTGDEARFKAFISELTRRMPHHRERIMTIAERIHNDGWLLGREKGKEEGEQRLLRLLLQNGADPEWIQKITGQSAEQIQALEQPLPDREHD